MKTAESVPTWRDTRSRANEHERGAPVHGLAYVLCADAPAQDAARLLWFGEMHEVAIGRGSEFVISETAGGLDARIRDQCISKRHALIHLRDGAYFASDRGSTNGTRINGHLIEREQALRPGDILETGHSFWRFMEFLPQPESHWASMSAKIGPTRTICPTLVDQVGQLSKVAVGNVSIVILGETGCGKEIVARHIHERSGRRGEFRAINCAAIPAPLLEEELFGHRRGAFTGAVSDRAGQVEAAHEGTLFLDEVGDLPAEAQVKLLRLLEDGEVVRLGDNRVRHVDIRVVAATHRDLPDLVRTERFRDDLYGRLAGFTLRLPPLRERLEDIGILIAHLLERLAGPEAAKVRFHPAVARYLFKHTWPFNVRELRQTLEAALLLAGDSRMVGVEHVKPALTEMAKASRVPRPQAETMSEEVVRERLATLMADHNGNISEVARAMGKPRSQIYRWLGRFGIPHPRTSD